MWKRGGQSAALDRALELLSAKKKNSNEHGSATKTQGAVVGSVRPNTQTLFSDVSDVSSVSLAPEHGADFMGSASSGRNKDVDSNKEYRPQSSLGGGRSRFLKKAPPPATNSGQIQQMPEPRYVSSSQHGSQTAALRKLAEIESRIRNRKQQQERARQGPKPAHNLTSDLGISPSPEAVSQALKTSAPVSAQLSNDQSVKGKRFLKTKANVVSDSVGAAGSVKNPDAGVMSWSRAASAAVPLVGLETRSVRAVSGVSLESDEEDMRKLLGDSFDSTDNSLLRPEKISSKKQSDKMFRKHSEKVCSTPPPVALHPPSSSNTAPPRSPTSPSRRSSPFRFTGQAQAQFSPSVLSPSPSNSCASHLPRNSPHRAGSPWHSLSPVSSLSEVVSLEELFPVGSDSGDLHSEMSLVSSEDFKANVMTLDDLVPAAIGFTEETPGKRQGKHSTPVPGSPNRHQNPPGSKEERKEEEQQQVEEDVLDYQSDFESESRTEQNYSASQVSEHLQGDEEEVASEVRGEALDSHGRTDDDYSSTFSDTSYSGTLQTSNNSLRSEPLSRSRGSRSSVSHGNQTSSHSRRRASVRKVLKEAAVQTQPDTMTSTWYTGMATSGPVLGMTFMNPTPVAVHTLSAERVEALSTYNPAVFVLNEMLKQQLAMTRQFIERSRYRHSSLVQSLEPPNYRYTTLQDTKECIRKHRPSKLTMEKVLQM
ncbi:uncharacterized protein C19orf44 homolog isoform X2 [Mastacembelus armatus]|uniref:Chromosome 4 C19orf44 homolog n=1 Tax=Mastacembelus armatus TaxID=205130 RepID=A0A3Q3RVG7_9TELE|nr:uncharacterized protein C19orf44 homolog isoform X2 [Mastacembelus armatus]